MEIVSGYCQICRSTEVEMYGEVISEWNKRHYEACKEGGCKHPVLYVFDKDEQDVYKWGVSDIQEMITSPDYDCNNIEEWYEEFESVFNL
tara:strand:+ start:1489 stop:1758 length:270 start_codon:yes stop_codon:yes gene_type:complete